MRKKYLPLYALFVAGMTFAWLAWPLPRHYTTGMPAAAHTGAPQVQPVMPSDTLQLLYHFWLAGDMLAGHTRPFYNLYEFNTGDDDQRFMPGSYYFPFSVCYAACSYLGSPAFAWNMTVLFSLWLTLWFTWLLALRFTSNLAIAGLAAFIALLLPFRWINLFGGSPAGFAMAWPPLVWLGVDMAIRQQRVRGGLWAGIAVLMACWCDSHVFFFTVLAIPLWCLTALLADPKLAWRHWRFYPQIFIALLPLLLCVAIALAFPLLLKWLTIQVLGAPPEAAAITIRTFKEIKLYSPPARGIFDRHAVGLAEHVFIGVLVPLLLLLGGLCLLVRAIWQRTMRRVVPAGVWLLLAVAGVGIVILALGVYGPGSGTALEIVRKLVPPWRMVRQPTKIFVLMPSLLAVMLTLAADVITWRPAWRKAGYSIMALITIAIAWQYGKRINAIIAILPPPQTAYTAIADDAAAAGTAPRAVVVPLWPGDSHQTSLYQFYATQQRIRLLNGYRPFVRQSYLTNVFERLVSINQGWLTPSQLAHLRAMQVRYIILHEDLFPEKVSPFPVAFTIKNLLTNPNLELLKQDQSVWAFKIRDEAFAMSHDQSDAADTTGNLAQWNIFGAARRWEAERCRHVNAITIDDEDAGASRALRFNAEGARMQTPPISVSPVPDTCWLVRARGYGVFDATLISETYGLTIGELLINSDNWEWYSLPAGLITAYAPLSLKLEWQGGDAAVDMALLTTGGWDAELPIGAARVIPAPCFFHAGHIELATDSVVLRKGADPKALIFYGPKLPLPAGKYQIVLEHTSPAVSGTPIAQFNIRQRSSDPIRWTPVFAGYPVQTEFELPLNLPFHLELLFLGHSDLQIHRVTFTRISR